MKPADPVRATDVLANERTFLAYVRTALAFVAFGFVIARFSLFMREFSILAKLAVPNSSISVTFGIAMAVAGVVFGAYGSYRYVAANDGLHRDETVALSPWAAIAGGIVVALIGATVAIDLFALTR
jgi:uncharacterized membrane protein YidH (DUF202 family)